MAKLSTPTAINRLTVITADSRLIGCCVLLYVRKIITTFSLLSCLFTLRFHLATQNKRKKPLQGLQHFTSINVIITQVWYCFYTAVPKTRSYYQVTDLLETILSDILFIFAAAAKKKVTKLKTVELEHRQEEWYKQWNVPVLLELLECHSTNQISGLIRIICLQNNMLIRAGTN